MQVLTMPPDHPESHGSGYGPNSWMNMGGYSQAGAPPQSMSPMHDYQGFDYHSAPMPTEPAYNMPRPPPYAPGVPQMPPPLIMPQNGIWPSMIASQSHQQSSFQPAILPAAPIQTPVSAGTGSDVTPTSAKTTTSRRKLTDEERRQMCLEAEQNPTMKQTQIGAKFNVERSTVSKILRQKEKYMNPPLPKEEVTSPGKKSKAKLPDFEKTLINWVKNQQKKGLPVTDEELKKQARVFSFSRSDQALLSSPSWLEKFKQKNGLGKHGDSVDSSTTSQSETPINASPVSSNGLVSPPMSAIDEQGRRSVAKEEQSDDYFDFDSKDDYGQSPQTSLSEMERSLSGPIMSPLSPDLSRDGDELPDFSMDDTSFVAGNSSRQRSQTFPHLTDYSTSSRPSSSGKPAIPMRSMTTSLESRPTGVDPRQMMKRHKSVPDIHDPEPIRFSSMHPPPLPKSADMSPISGPVSPAEDDNIKALHSIKKLLEEHPGVADSDDYIAIGKLMEKLKLLRSPSVTPQLPGGMHPVDILDSPRNSKKRTIMGIST